MSRLFSNPVLMLWVSYQRSWDRIDSLDRTEAFVDRLCAFINPEGMKAITESRDNEMVAEINVEPKPKVDLPEGLQKVLSGFKANEFDEIILGGDDA